MDFPDVEFSQTVRERSSSAEIVLAYRHAEPFPRPLCALSHDPFYPLRQIGEFLTGSEEGQIAEMPPKNFGPFYRRQTPRRRLHQKKQGDLFPPAFQLLRHLERHHPPEAIAPETIGPARLHGRYAHQPAVIP